MEYCEVLTSGKIYKDFDLVYDYDQIQIYRRKGQDPQLPVLEISPVIEQEINQGGMDKSSSVKKVGEIIETAGFRDNVTFLARRAIIEYNKNTNQNLQPYQMMFMENSLADEHVKDNVSQGNTISFPISELDELVKASANQSQTQINTWSYYARRVNYSPSPAPSI